MLSGLVSSGLTGPTRSRAQRVSLTLSGVKNTLVGGNSLFIQHGAIRQDAKISPVYDGTYRRFGEYRYSPASLTYTVISDGSGQYSIGNETLQPVFNVWYSSTSRNRVTIGAAGPDDSGRGKLGIFQTTIDGTGVILTANNGYSATSFRMMDDGAITNPTTAILEIRNGATAQTFRTYGTYTSATSYETLNFKGKAAANFEIGPENGSAGGTLRGLTIGGYALGSATITGWLQFRPNATTAALEAFYLGPIADSTSTGGNARGTGAVDLQTSRTAAAQVASGIYSFCQGYDNNASGAYSFASGYNSTASAYGMQAHAAGYFAANGDAQSARFVLRRKTTDATATTLMLDGSTTRLTITSGKIMFCDILISGIKSDGSGAACYKRKVAIKNVAGTTALVGSVETIGTDIEDNAATDVAITADNTNDALQINVTGIAAETWRWVAVVEGLEIAYGT